MQVYFFTSPLHVTHNILLYAGQQDILNCPNMDIFLCKQLSQSWVGNKLRGLNINNALLMLSD